MIDIPRKLSARDGHPLKGKLQVYLSGEQMRLVEAYDMDAGTVMIVVTDERNRPILQDGVFLTRILTGKVTVMVKP